MNGKREVIVARNAGFCFGVTRAVDTVYELLEKGTEDIYTLGPIIHNEQVVEKLEKRGVRVLNEPSELTGHPGASVVIRSHGVDEATEKELRQLGAKVIDATCPFVKKIHRIVRKAGNGGRTVIIVGDATHPEVQGIRGWCGGPSFVVGSEDEVNALPELKKVTIVSQTTLSNKIFKNVVEKITEKCYDYYALNTICNATQERQKEAEVVAGTVDAMIVIGGRNSSNTQKLYSICKDVCDRTYYVRTADDLSDCELEGMLRVGITAGASTPKEIIEEIIEHVGREF